MTATGTNETIYVVPVERATESVAELLNRNIHQYFIAYLHLRRQSALQGTTDEIAPDWAELSRVLHVEGHPEKKPHLRPFWPGQRDAGQEWMNENLAGSYAPSSLRDVARQVVDTNAERQFILREGHVALALEHFLGGSRVPVLPLAAFLFRDRGLVASEPSDTHLVTVFREEYGYGEQSEDEFAALFDADWASDTEGPWLEPWDGGVAEGDES